MAAVLNAASNALNQIYDLEIDRVNKPRRRCPRPARNAWSFTVATYPESAILSLGEIKAKQCENSH